MIDQHVLSLIVSVINMKFDQIISNEASEALKEDVLQTIRLAGKICTQRSYAELVRNLKQSLPRYFGFQAVGVMLKDQKTDLMFTVNEIS